MGRIKDIDAQGVTDLYSYSVGYEDATERIIELAKKLEHKSMTHSELCTREHYFIEKLIAAIKEEK